MNRFPYHIKDTLFVVMLSTLCFTVTWDIFSSFEIRVQPLKMFQISAEPDGNFCCSHSQLWAVSIDQKGPKIEDRKTNAKNYITGNRPFRVEPRQRPDPEHLVRLFRRRNDCRKQASRKQKSQKHKHWKHKHGKQKRRKHKCRKQKRRKCSLDRDWVAKKTRK